MPDSFRRHPSPPPAAAAAAAPDRRAPERLLDLVSEEVGEYLGRGSFKMVHLLGQTGYVVTEVLRYEQSEQKFDSVLRETAIQLRLRVNGLKDKLRALGDSQPYVGGGRHIVKTVGFDPVTTRTVMKYGGYSLSALLPPHGPGQADEPVSLDNDRDRILTRFLASVAKQALEGLAFSHRAENDLIHSDIKLENIVVGRRGRVTLIDWGVSTGSGQPWAGGTRGYMPPRFAALPREQRVGPTTDVYAIGCTLFYLARGYEKNLRGERVVAEVQRVLDRFTDPDLRDFVTRCLDSDQGDAAAEPGFSTADEALGHPFVRTVDETMYYSAVLDYVREFLGHRERIMTFYGSARPRANAVVAGRRATRIPPDYEAKLAEFKRTYPSLVPLLEEVTRLTVQAELLRSRVREIQGKTNGPRGAFPPGSSADENP